MNYEDHPIAQIFPLLPEPELSELAEDIKANGLREPVILFEGKILDGRNRYRAASLAGVNPTFEQFTNGSPTSFVISLNLKRRHLTATQKATASVESLPHFEREAKERQKRKPADSVSQKVDTQSKSRASEQAAEMFHTNRQYVSDAKAIKDRAPLEFEKMRTGEKTLSQVKRELRKQDAVAKVRDFPTDKFRVLYADPPWKYGDTKEVEGWEGTAAEHHYPTLSIAELCAMPIPDLVEANAVLFMWVTSPLLFECVPLVSAWGFKYKASFVWDKERHNVGNYCSVRHEFLLICTRGSCTPDVKKLFDSVQTIPRTGRHSEKPKEFREIIETLYPHGKRLELFARNKAEGWESWGNDGALA